MNKTTLTLDFPSMYPILKVLEGRNTPLPSKQLQTSFMVFSLRQCMHFSILAKKVWKVSFFFYWYVSWWVKGQWT